MTRYLKQSFLEDDGKIKMSGHNAQSDVWQKHHQLWGRSEDLERFF